MDRAAERTGPRDTLGVTALRQAKPRTREATVHDIQHAESSQSNAMCYQSSGKPATRSRRDGPRPMDALQQAVKRSSASIRRRFKSVAKGGTCGGDHMILRQHAGGEVASASQQVVLPQKIFAWRYAGYSKRLGRHERDSSCGSGVSPG